MSPYTPTIKILKNKTSFHTSKQPSNHSETVYFKKKKMTAAQHSFLGLSKCPVSVPVHAFGLGLVACSLYHSYKVYSKIPAKETGVQMPVAFDFLGRPAVYAHPCIGAALYPTLILLQSGAECGYGMIKEAAQNAKKEPAHCPISCCARVGLQLVYATSIITLFAQTVATHVVVDKKKPEEVKAEAEKGNTRYTIAPWQVAVPLAIAFAPTVAAAVCRALHKK